ncbi:hypothetical protein Esti_000927 [Eimeria stiedai]
MGLWSWLKSKTKREKKLRKPPEVPTAAQQAGGPSAVDGSDQGDELKKIVVYPLFDPRRVSPRGSVVPLLDWHESLTKQLTSIPGELLSAELITLPRSRSSSEALEPSARLPEPEEEEEEEMPLRPADGDQSPLSGVSMEAAFELLTRKPSRAPSFVNQQQQEEQQQQPVLVKPRPASPQQAVSPPKKTETQVVVQPKPRETQEPPVEPQRVKAPSRRQSPPPAAPKPSPEPAAASEPIAPLPLPPKLKSRSSSRSSRGSSGEVASSRSCLPSIDESSKSEASLDIEDMPTAPTTPRLPSRALQRSKQPRLLLLQPHTKPHPATTRMQREGRRCLLRCAQLQAAIDIYAARGGLKAFRVQPHDLEECLTCNYADFTDAPLLW